MKTNFKLRRVLGALLAVVLVVQLVPPVTVAQAAAAPMRITASTYADTGYFGDGSDGDLIVGKNETKVLPVDVPHQSIVIKNYKSITIEAGGVLTTSDPNAGLVLKATGDVTIKGTIDQSGKAPKTNPSNNYPYPAELICGAGGNGGQSYATKHGSDEMTMAQVGGSGMAARSYGGGYGGGGAGGAGFYYQGGKGGDANNIMSTDQNIFIGGEGGAGLLYGNPGSYGGGGGGAGKVNNNNNAKSGKGGSGGGTSGEASVTAYGGGGGGAGNCGGGIVVIYCGGNLNISGTIRCNGVAGGAGGNTMNAGTGGGGGGGGGGGAIFISYAKESSTTGVLNVNAGVGGAGGIILPITSNEDFGYINGQAGEGGINGIATVKKAPDSIPPVISSVTVSTSWGASSTVTINATDNMSSVKEYAYSTANAAPSGGWQTGSSFTISANGTYYAFAKDGMGNKSGGWQFEVANIDTTAPVISSAAVTPAGWAGSSKTITVIAGDNGQSGVKAYAITQSPAVPAAGDWQLSTAGTFTFTKPEGTYFVWAKDGVGLVSASKQVDVSQIDTTAPVLGSVTVTPEGWTNNPTKVITASAADSQSGVSAYAITESPAAPTAGNWQLSTAGTFTFSKPEGTYRIWAKDSVDNVSAHREVKVEQIDTDKPVISDVVLPSTWGQSNTAVINAYDDTSAVNIYSFSYSDTVPMDGWSEERSHTYTENGTYFAWCKDMAGNISDSFSFEVKMVDTAAPVVTAAVVTPEGWTNKSTKSIALSAEDSQSKVAGYQLTTDANMPIGGFTPSSTFSKPEGTYYAWAQDKAGRVSEGVPVVVDMIDTDKPSVAHVNITEDWGSTANITIEASDAYSGVAEYAVSSYSFAPGTGWQPENSFTRDNNGKYYAFVRDRAGNVSDAAQFEIDTVDKVKPIVERVNIPPGYSGSLNITVDATDSQSGIGGYAITKSFVEPAADAWQGENKFTISENGTFYAWARDIVGNISAGRYFNVSTVDKTIPEIASIGYSTDYKTIMVRGKDTGSGVACILIDDVQYEGSNVSAELAEGTRFVSIVVEDKAGNKSAPVTERVPGWHDILETLTIKPVEFTENNQRATITAESTETAIAGIYVDSKLKAGNPVSVPVSSGTQYLEVQAVDVNGDRSIVYRVRVPGWNAVVSTLSIVDVQFSADSTTAKITAVESGGKGLHGIRVNGELFPENPLVYEIPSGVRHLELQAEDNFGDRSALVRRRVPGWSEVVTTLSITDVTFVDYNTTAKITATATGGDTVDGIYVNDTLLEGNPVVYKVPKGTETLHIQAVNPNGDRSPMLNKPVPMDSSKSTLKLYIEAPGWTSDRKAKVKLVAEDKNHITKVMVRTSEQNEWADVTDLRYIYITTDTVVYASVENDKGEIKEEHLDIECFDKKSPTVTAARDGNVVNIRASDDKSGVVRILVNNKEFSEDEVYDGKLTYHITKDTGTVIVKAEDRAGNLSRAVEIQLQSLSPAVPVIVAPTPSPTPELPPEDAKLPEVIPPKQAEAIPEPIPTTEPVQETVADSLPKPISPVQQAAAIGTVGSTAIGGIWYWLRRIKLNKPVEELELMGKKLIWDESEFGGTIDPLDKLDEGGKEDV